MKRLGTILLAHTLMLGACEKETTTNEDQPINNSGDTTQMCETGSICFELNDTAYSRPTTGYEFSDTFLFAKYEHDNKQLSIDILGNSVGSYPAGDTQTSGKSRIYYFKGIGADQVMYMSTSGSVEVSSYENKKLTATFTGTLEKQVNGSYTGETITVTNGNINAVTLF